MKNTMIDSLFNKVHHIHTGEKEKGQIFLEWVTSGIVL